MKPKSDKFKIQLNDQVTVFCKEAPVKDRVNRTVEKELAFTATLREFLAKSPREFDPRKILGPAKEAMKENVKGKMRLSGSSGKAS